MKTRDFPEFMKISSRTVIKIAVIAVCALLFTLLAVDVVGDYRMGRFDEFVYLKIHSLNSNFATGFFKIITNMVHPAVMVAVSITMIHVLKKREYLAALIVNLILTGLLNLVMKQRFMRVRPPREIRLVNEWGYSFPSGHAMFAAAFYGFIIFLLIQANLTRIEKILGTIFCVIVALLVGMSRVYLGVHYATDILGGYLMSTIYLIVYTGVVKRYLKAGVLEDSTDETPSKHKLISSFGHAFDGILDGLIKERNMMIHYSALILVIVFGITLRLSIVEWSICLILCAIVIALELINTAVEAVVDLVTEEWDERAKLAKDTAAGAVLVAAIIAVVIGGLIFIPKIIELFTL